MSSFVVFEAFGVSISVRSPGVAIADRIRESVKAALPANLFFLREDDAQFRFEIVDLDEGDFSVRGPDGWIIRRADLEQAIGHLASTIRLTVAEHAPANVFVHSGSVAWKGQGIIIPGTSYSGKTTLTAELVRRGASYLSDEYAVLDRNGFLHPFPKTLSIRGIIDDYRQVEIDVAEIGGSVATTPVPVGAVVLTRYRENAVWDPERLRVSLGVLEVIKNTVPVRRSPARTLQILNRVAETSIFLRSDRGDAAETAAAILDYLDQLP